MRRTQTFVASLLLALIVLVSSAVHPGIGLILLPLGVHAAKRTDFKSIAGELEKKGVKAMAPAALVGKSGVRHEFAFAVVSDSGPPKVVVDTELSVGEVDEMKVLRFYVKAYDVSPDRAVLCVCPSLGDRAKILAKEYGITVLEDEVPRKLVGKAADVVDSITRSDGKQVG